MKRPRPTPPKAHSFEQNVIALVWDFDKTLISDYMQTPLFDHYQIDGERFWKEVNGLQEWYGKQKIPSHADNLYLNHLLTYVKEGKLPGLNREKLKSFGKKLKYYPGLPQFLKQIKQRVANNATFARFGIQLEHYIVSTGFADTIRGSDVYQYVNGVWGTEFIEDAAPSGYLDHPATPAASKSNAPEEKKEKVISQIAMALDNTTKTRALFEISKGSNIFPEIDVNSKMKDHNRRIPFTNMIYIADGPSDVPAFSIINQFGGRTFAIYPDGDQTAFEQVDKLRDEGRIHLFGPADYSENTQTWLWLVSHVEKIGERIVKEKEKSMREAASSPPKFL